MSENIKTKVANWIVGLSLLAIFLLAVADLLLEESVPLIVYGIIGGIAYGADGDILKGFGWKK